MIINVLWDWLSFTIKHGRYTDPELVIADVLRMDPAMFQRIKGSCGYAQRLYFDGISVHYSGRADMGIWVNLSGQGCRCFESFSAYGWDELREKLHAIDAEVLEGLPSPDAVKRKAINITRCDLACDMIAGCMPDGTEVPDLVDCPFIRVSDLENKIRNYEWKGCFHRTRNCCAFEWSGAAEDEREGYCAWFGSPSSAVRLRIYDKAAERGVPKDCPCLWTRMEYQLRDEHAATCWNGVNLKTGLYVPIKDRFFGIMRRYLSFVEPTRAKRRDCPVCDWWEAFVGAGEQFGLFVSPGVDYNISRVRHYVAEQAGNAFDCLVDVFGMEKTLDFIRKREARPNPKYEIIRKKYVEP